jgi:hypothetical protein
MLLWLVTVEAVEKALKMKERIDRFYLVFQEHQVECHPDLVTMACIDDTVDMKLVKKYLTVDAWKAVESVMKAKTRSKIYSCGVCKHKLGKQSISCDGCLNWFDFKCVGLNAAPKANHWFYRDCRAMYATTQ